jgi:hypothetical protein
MPKIGEIKYNKPRRAIMKVRMINKDGKAWDFNSVKSAKPHLKKDSYYEIKVIDGEKIRIYDDRLL